MHKAKLTLIILVILLAACSQPVNATLPAIPPTSTAEPIKSPTSPPQVSPTPVQPTTEVQPPTAGQSGAELPLFRDPGQPIALRVDDLLARMNLQEKIGQMTQIEKNSLTPEVVTEYYLGSVLSGGDGYPAQDRSAQGWKEMVDSFQEAALDTRLSIPLIYGVDAVHGFGNLYGATLFPQNIGLGATRDPDLVERIGQATAEEMLAVGIPWNFAPVVAVPQDIRWGRTYEGYSENTALVSLLGSAYINGLQSSSSGPAIKVLATPKHFLGDGGTTWGTSTTNIMNHPYQLDQGDMRVDEGVLRELFLPPYQASIAAGAESVMASFSSWNGQKMHANEYLLSDVLKGELGFQGFVVSDWGAVDQLPGNYYDKVAAAINAGVDMVMAPSDYMTFTTTLVKAVENGDVSLERVDDAVRRILTTKFKLGLFEQKDTESRYIETVGSASHRELAREAVRKSLVLLKNEDTTLPLEHHTPTILVAGEAADDIGMQSGGWTMGWQGSTGAIQPGTTILQAIQAAAPPDSQVLYSPLARFNTSEIADVGILVIGETPYAEGVGDQADLTPKGVGLIDKLRPRVKKLVVVLLTGRPVEITGQLPQIDALVAAWWPGTEGQGVADVLFGDYPFTGKLPYTWPRWSSQLPFDFANLPAQGCSAPLFLFGYGLSTSDPSPEIPVCPKK